MPEKTKEIKELQEEISGLLAGIQKGHETLEAEGKSNSEGLVKMGLDFEEVSEKLQVLTTEAEGEKKAREELELSLARMGDKKSNDEDIGTPEYKKSFDFYLRSKAGGVIDTDIVNAEFKALLKSVNAENLSPEQEMGLKTLLVGSQPDGGYFVPVDQQSRIIKRLFETSPMRNLAAVITTGTEAVSFIIDDTDLLTSGWVSELDDRPETGTPQVGEIDIPVHEQYAMPISTQKMLDDSIFNVESWLTEKINTKFARTENTAFVNGTGIKQPTGFLTYAAWAAAGVYERGKIEQRESAVANTIDGDDLLNLQSDLLEGYQSNSTWVMHRKIWVEVLKLKDTTDQYLLNPAMLFTGSLGPQLLGRPVVMFSDMAATLANNALNIAYGDFREGYVLVDRIGMRILRDPFTTKGKVKFYTTKRVGGDVVNYQAIKILKTKSV